MFTFIKIIYLIKKLYLIFIICKKKIKRVTIVMSGISLLLKDL